jgi:hypothetical protein
MHTGVTHAIGFGNIRWQCGPRGESPNYPNHRRPASIRLMRPSTTFADGAHLVEAAVYFVDGQHDELKIGMKRRLDVDLP